MKDKKTQYKCMLCGNWHEDGSKVLNEHVHNYFNTGGTFSLSEWEKRTK